MYENFILKSEDMDLFGYNWPAENPDAVVCLIHGIGEYAARYNEVAEIFNKYNISLVSMDLRGHGRTRGTRGHAAPRNLILKDLDNLIKYAQSEYPGKDIFIYGHSMGGNIGLDYRINGKFRDTPKGYVITDPWLILIKKVSPPLQFVVSLISKIKPDFTLKTGLDVKQLAHVENEIKKYAKDSNIHGRISVQTAIDCMKAGEQILSNTSQQKGRLLLMHGTMDKICDIQGSRQLKKIEGENAMLIEWEGLYHEIHNEKEREAVIQTIIKWIKKD